MFKILVPAGLVTLDTHVTTALLKRVAHLAASYTPLVLLRDVLEYNRLYYMLVDIAVGFAHWGALMVLKRRALCPVRGMAGFRRCRGSDDEQVARLLDTCFSGYPWWRGVTPEELRCSWSREGSVCIVLEEGGEIVAYAYASVKPSCRGNAIAEVEAIAVHLRLRGKGVGSKLLSIIVESLADKTDTIVVDAAVGVEGFYERLGFEQVTRWLAAYTVTTL